MKNITTSDRPSNSRPPFDILQVLSKHSRRELEGFIAVAIDLLDLADGDPDIEDDDPAGDPLDEHGEAPTEDGRQLLPMIPRYGIDQARGPLNEAEAHRDWHERMMAEA